MLTFLTRRLTVGMVGGALLVAALATDCSAPIANYVDTGEMEAGMVSRCPWGIPKALTIESGGVTAILSWRVSFTIMNWVHVLWMSLNLMLWVVTFVRKHTVTWLAVVTISILLAGILGGAMKLAIYLDLQSAVSVLESDVVRTGNYESEMHSQLGKL